MAREYSRVHDFYLHLQDFQPSTPHFQYDLLQTNTSATPTLELTTGMVPSAGADSAFINTANALVAMHAPLQPTMPMPHHTQTYEHDQLKNNSNLSPDNFTMRACDTEASTVLRFSTTGQRKRKSSSYGTASTYGDDGVGDDSRSVRTVSDKKYERQNHSEIEKRRRDKMNTYLNELSGMIPMCVAISRKLDKLTVLRMAVQHMRSVRGALAACPLTARPRPAFVSEREHNALILQAAHDSFLMVVGCNRGRLLYISASVEKMLHYDQSELLGQSLFDILHPKDVAKVKEQLSSSDLSPREKLIDAKTMLPVKADVVAGASRLSPGARRSFFCRIKCKTGAAPSRASPVVHAKSVNEERPNVKLRKKIEKKYCVIQCTGYLKSWMPAEVKQVRSEGVEDGDVCNLSCLVAVGRGLPDLTPATFCATPALSAPATRQLQYVSRHAIDGKFLFVDQRVTLALGFLPQELLGTSLYEYVCGPELRNVARTHKTALLQRAALLTPTYGFRRKDGTVAKLQTHFKPFRNPWTKDVEYLVANNTVILESQPSLQPENEQVAFDIFKEIDTGNGDGSPSEAEAAVAGEVVNTTSETDIEMQRLIDSHVESHKIGNAIAEEALRRPSNDFSPELPAELLQDVSFNQQLPLVDNILGIELEDFSQVRNNVPLTAAMGGCQSPLPAGGVLPLSVTPPPASPPLPSLGNDGNGEAAMAVIMSLLEADAGLGGPINFSELPWPLS